MSIKKPDRSPKAPRPQQQNLTISQATIEKGFPGSTIRHWINQGELPFIKLGRRIWIRRVDLDALIEKSVERRAS